MLAFQFVPAPWNALEHDAAWRDTIWRDVGAWQAFHGGLGRLHPLFSLLGVSILSLAADSMHIFDLGISHYVIGSVLWELCFTRNYVAGNSAKARIDEVWSRIKTYYQRMGTSCQLSNLNLSFFVDVKRPNKFPQL